MARYCIYPGCQRRLRTGQKYCYVHRSFGKESKRPGKRGGDPFAEMVWYAFLLFVFGCIMTLIMYYPIKFFKQFMEQPELVVLPLMAFIIFIGCIIYFKIMDKRILNENKIKQTKNS